MKIFISGIMQGGAKEMKVSDQSYREGITKILLEYYEDAQIIDPLDFMVTRFGQKQGELFSLFQNLNSQNVIYKESLPIEALEVTNAFNEIMDLVISSDILIAFLGEKTSMGTAMEIWQAYKNRIPIITITSLKHNLSILSTSTLICETLDDFKEVISSQDIRKLYLDMDLLH